MDASPWESLFLPGTRPTKLACLVPWRPCAKTGTRDVRSKPKKPPPLCRLSGWSTDPGTCHCHRTLGQSCPWSLGSWPGFLMVGSRPDRRRCCSKPLLLPLLQKLLLWKEVLHTLRPSQGHLQCLKRLPRTPRKARERSVGRETLPRRHVLVHRALRLTPALGHSARPVQVQHCPLRHCCGDGHHLRS